MKDRVEVHRERHRHKHRHSSPENERPKKRKGHHKERQRSRSPGLGRSCSSEDEMGELRRRERKHQHRHHHRSHHHQHHSRDNSRHNPPPLLVTHIKEEPMSNDDDDTTTSRTSGQSNHVRGIKQEIRDDSYRPKERSRWENDEDSPNPRDTRNPRKRERSGDRFLKALKGDSGPEHTWGKSSGPTEGGPKKPVENKAKPDFGLSGKLTEDTNMFNGVVIKYSEPPEARKPKRRWRLYPFKGDEGLPTLFIHRQSAYLIGRDRKVADIPVDHPSCSKQHAALQYRVVPYSKEDGTSGRRIRPYIIDLESANGTYINNVKIDPKKYVELFEKDVIKFAYSSREYVLLHEHSKGDEYDDNFVE